MTIEAAPQITIAYMGDSITEGQFVHHSLRWTELVSNVLRKRYEGDFNDLHFFFNRGVSGETTRQGLERFPRDIQQIRPDVMTLQFGLNDCNCWDSDLGLPRVSEAAFRANLEEMIDRARRFHARHIILSTNHPTLRFRKLACGQTLEERRIAYNAIVRDVAHGTGVTLCDIDEIFSNVDREQRKELVLPEPDVLHLSPAGHRVYADAICPLLASAVDSLRASAVTTK